MLETSIAIAPACKKNAMSEHSEQQHRVNAHRRISGAHYMRENKDIGTDTEDEDEEFFDSKSHFSSAKGSLEVNSRTGVVSPNESVNASPNPELEASGGVTKEGQMACTPRYRSLTEAYTKSSQNSLGSSREGDAASARTRGLSDSLQSETASSSSLCGNTPSETSGATDSGRSSSLHSNTSNALSSCESTRVAALQAISKGRQRGQLDSAALIEQRARRAVKAMAEACTTGVTVRESMLKREKVFDSLMEKKAARNGVAKSHSSMDALHDNTQPLRPSSTLQINGEGNAERRLSPKVGLQNRLLHQVSSHSRISGLIYTETPVIDRKSNSQQLSLDDYVNNTGIPANSDGRALSMTREQKVISIARSASLEARIDNKTREGLSKWIMCFGTVDFDADQGPTLNLLYPHVPFSDSERAAICFSSMPDSTIHELYDSVYTFHFRINPTKIGLPKDQIFLYGHVFFRQKRDPLMRRGGFQRSIVVISHLPYHGLFSRIAHMLGPLYFDLGTAILETAAHNIAIWPLPEPGESLELPFLGTALNVVLPTEESSQLLETSRFPLDRFDPGEHILASITCDGLFRSFRDTLHDLWACWELMILGESLVVFADTPARCSEAIVSLVDIIFPITYCGDYRPYFTIQDPDFRAIVSKTHVPSNTVVGVSNPFFSEAMGHWPHKLFLGSSDRMSQMHGVSVRRARTFGSDSSGSNGTNSNKNVNGSISSGNSVGMGGSHSGGMGNKYVSNHPGVFSSGTHHIKQGLQSKRKCVVSKDRPFAEHLLSALKTGKHPPWIVNNMLRRYFIDLTVQFLAPLNRYFTTLIPQVCSSTSIVSGNDTKHSPWQRDYKKSNGLTETLESLTWFAPPNSLRPWRTDDFMASLSALGIAPQLSGRYNGSSAADVISSMLSGNSSSSSSGSSGDGGGSISGANGTSSGLHNSSGSSGQATAHASSQGHSALSDASQATISTFWRSKKNKKISDEWQQLYSQFLQCGNFATWLAHRTKEAQHALLIRYRSEVCQGDAHAWCRGYDHPLSISAQQLAAEIKMLDLATMDLGQSLAGRDSQHPRARHIFYHGKVVDERLAAERQRLNLLKERKDRLAWSERAVHGSDGSLIGYTNKQASPRSRAQLTPAPAPHSPSLSSLSSSSSSSLLVDTVGDSHLIKQLGQRITHSQRPSHILLQAAWQVVELLSEPASSTLGLPKEKVYSIPVPCSELYPPTEAERQQLLDQLSIILEYLPAESGRVFLPLVPNDYRRNGMCAR